MLEKVAINHQSEATKAKRSKAASQDLESKVNNVAKGCSLKQIYKNRAVKQLLGLGSVRLEYKESTVEKWREKLSPHDFHTKCEKRNNYIGKPKCSSCGIVPHSVDSVPTINLNKETNKAFLSNVIKCGSVWECPVCKYKISKIRAEHLKHVENRHHLIVRYLSASTDAEILAIKSFIDKNESIIQQYIADLKNIKSALLMAYDGEKMPLISERKQLNEKLDSLTKKVYKQSAIQFDRASKLLNAELKSYGTDVEELQRQEEELSLKINKSLAKVEQADEADLTRLLSLTEQVNEAYDNFQEKLEKKTNMYNKNMIGYSCMITYTASHKRQDSLVHLVGETSKDGLIGAFSSMKSQRAYRNNKVKYSMIGDVRSIEVTDGKTHGWHPHVHQLMFFLKKHFKHTSKFIKEVEEGVKNGEHYSDELLAEIAVDKAKIIQMEDELYAIWKNAIDKQYPTEKGKTNREALRITVGTSADYISKWGASSELTRGAYKNGKGSSITDLETELSDLYDYFKTYSSQQFLLESEHTEKYKITLERLRTLHELEIDDKVLDKRYKVLKLRLNEYYQVMEGRRFISYSGATSWRKAVGIGETEDDKELILADEIYPEDQTKIITEITKQQLKAVHYYASIYDLLVTAEKEGAEGVKKYLVIPLQRLKNWNTSLEDLNTSRIQKIPKKRQKMKINRKKQLAGEYLKGILDF